LALLSGPKGTFSDAVSLAWSPIHLRTKLKELYWKEGQPGAKAMAFWEDTLRYLYLPRLKNRDVLAHTIHSGSKSRDFFGTAYGQSGETFDGFEFGSTSVQFDDTLLLIKPETAKRYEESQSKPGEPIGGGAEPPHPGPSPGGSGAAVAAKVRSFHGMAEVASATAKMRLVQLADEIITVLSSDPNAAVKITVDIAAEFPDGATDQVKRAVSENARSLGLKSADWE
jgi:uncharacterized protein